MGKNIILIAFLLTLLSCRDSAKVNTEVVTDFDLNQYLGKWYEIYRFDNKFEKDLVGVTAEYSLRKDGKIKVKNSGYKYNLSGQQSIAIGKAKQPDSNYPAKLKVSFFAFFYADYFVLEIDKDYQWAVVGSSSDKYLWILSRTKFLDDNIVAMLKEKLEARGYDISNLMKVNQSD
jgi:apolipoprotein D and lipocalin family protein